MSRTVLPLLSALLLASATGCSDNGTSAADAATDQGVHTFPEDALAPNDGTTDGLVLSTTIRVAHLALGLGEVDFCYRPPASQAYVGPVLGHPTQTADGGESLADGSGADGEAAEAGDATVSEAAADAPMDGVVDAIDGAAADATNDAGDGGGDASEDAGLPTALAPLALTAYLTLPAAGTFDFAIVPSGAATCASPLLSQRITLDAGKRYTLALLGTGPGTGDGGADAGSDASLEGGASSDLGILSLTDDPMQLAGSFRVRMVHAAVDGPGTRGALRVSLQGGAQGGVPIAASVAPRQAATPSATPPMVDALGYHSDAPHLGMLSFECDAAGDAGGAAWVSVPFDLQLTSSSVHTGFIVADDTGKLGVLWCDDGSSGGGLTPCHLVGGE